MGSAKGSNWPAEQTDISDSQLSPVIIKNYSNAPRIPMGIRGLVQFPNINIITLVKRKDISFILTIIQRISGTNDTSFESPYIGCLESAKNWAWHHPEGGHAPLTEKALLLLELVWSLS